MACIDKVPTTHRRTITNKTRLKVVDGDVPTAESSWKRMTTSTSLLTLTLLVLSTKTIKLDCHNHKLLWLAIGWGCVPKPNEEIALASIPPDVAENYAEHYPLGQWIDPGAFVKSSDLVEQSIEGFLPNGVSYDMDERDVAWFNKHNSAAKVEGTSSSAGSPDKSRAAKMHGEDVAAEQPSFVIPKNEFEFTTGLFEKITDEKCPYLHFVCSILLCCLSCSCH